MWRVTSQRWYDTPKHPHIPLQQIQPRLPLALPGPRRHDTEIRPDRDGVIGGGVDLGAGEEGGGVLQVQHLSSELVRHGVHEDELVGDVLGEDGLGYGHAHVARANDGDFGVSLGGRGRGSVENGLEEGLG